MDETATGYGLLAEDVDVVADGLSATFRLRPERAFNGKPVLAQDVKHSYDTLVGPFTSPAYKTLLARWPGWMWWTTAPCATASSCPTASCPSPWVACRCSAATGGVENGKAKPFDQVVTDIPIGSGPYKIGPVQFGKDITYVRDLQYWGAPI